MNARRSNIFRLLIFATRFRLLKLLCVVLNSWNSQITSTPKGGYKRQVQVEQTSSKWLSQDESVVVKARKSISHVNLGAACAASVVSRSWARTGKPRAGKWKSRRLCAWPRESPTTEWRRPGKSPDSSPCCRCEVLPQKVGQQEKVCGLSCEWQRTTLQDELIQEVPLE